ncbi:MAG TPA: response regulator [Sulfuricurvum sp.]|nr:response regulator [Sulfuricurvum sp.]
MNTNIHTLTEPFEKSIYTVAVIDHDQTLNHLLSQELREAGCTVLQAFSSEEISGILHQNPDFIIIDPVYEACHELTLCDYLKDPGSAGVVVFTSNPNNERRDNLFECGILECFQKDEPLDEVVDELLHLFDTIQSNIDYHITIISDAKNTQEKLKKLISHRKYSSCFLNNCDELKEKWEYHAHDFPDLIILDLKDAGHFKQAFDFIHYIRIHRLLEIPIVAMLDCDGNNLSPKLYRAGVNDVLVMPFSAEKLLTMVTHHLDYRISKKWLRYEHSLSNQLKVMIDSSSIVSKANLNGNITYVNEEFCQISGYTKKELIGQPHSIIRHPDNSPMLFQQMWQTLQEKKTFHGILMNRRKDGSTYYVDTTIAPLLDDNQEIMEYISIRHDVTPLIEKQQELEEQRRQVQNVLDAQTSLICMVDKIEGVRQANTNFMEFLGMENISVEACECKFLNGLFLDAEDAFTVQHGERYVWLDRLYEMRGQFVKVVLKDRFYNHHVFSIHVAKLPDARFSHGICYLVTMDNVTELNRALREAKASSEAESRFLATMSHEIRTPLNGILGFAELLSETSLNPQQIKYLKAITSSGETLRQIINDILDVMKMDREQLKLTNEPINIIGELESMIYPFYAQAEKKGIDLLVYIDPKLPLSIETDSLRLKQILINLISNAIKFTSAQKRVYVRIKHLKTVEGKITIGFTVADEGIGVAKEKQANIFKPFVQADNSISREFGGTGLGLSIVLRVVSAMNGHLSFKSIPGKGSVFHTLLTFTTDSLHHLYQCKRHTTHLYLPVPNATPRFKLVERYLKRFACCESQVYRTAALDALDDHSDLHIVVFKDTISFSEVVNATKKFKKATLFIVPSFQSNAPFIPLVAPNIVWLLGELTWSTLAKGLGIYNHDKLFQRKQHSTVTFKGLKILIAEDNEVNQLYIQELLKKLDIDHDLAVDGYHAVKKFINGKYDMVLMDINMPNMDGITATQQMLHYEEETGAVHTPIIGLSADAVTANIAQYLQKGLDGYLIKPLQKADLITLLQENFASHSMEKNISETKIQREPIMHLENNNHEGLKTRIASQLELPEEIVLELFKKFISNTSVILTQFRENIDNEEALKIAVHSLKGITRNLFLTELGDACHNFEIDMPSLDHGEKEKRLEAIRAETENIIQQMKKELE